MSHFLFFAAGLDWLSIKCSLEFFPPDFFSFPFFLIVGEFNIILKFGVMEDFVGAFSCLIQKYRLIKGHESYCN